jgi:hypothetical protein
VFFPSFCRGAHIWRPQADTSGAPSALLQRRGRPQLRISVPAAYTNVASDDIVVLVCEKQVMLPPGAAAALARRLSAAENTAPARSAPQATRPSSMDDGADAKRSRTACYGGQYVVVPSVHSGQPISGQQYQQQYQQHHQQYQQQQQQQQSMVLSGVVLHPELAPAEHSAGSKGSGGVGLRVATPPVLLHACMPPSAGSDSMLSSCSSSASDLAAAPEASLASLAAQRAHHAVLVVQGPPLASGSADGSTLREYFQRQYDIKAEQAFAVQQTSAADPGATQQQEAQSAWAMLRSFAFGAR